MGECRCECGVWFLCVTGRDWRGLCDVNGYVHTNNNLHTRTPARAQTRTAAATAVRVTTTSTSTPTNHTHFTLPSYLLSSPTNAPTNPSPPFHTSLSALSSLPPNYSNTINPQLNLTNTLLSSLFLKHQDQARQASKTCLSLYSLNHTHHHA